MAGGPGARLRAPGGVQGQCPGGGRGGEAPPKLQGFYTQESFQNSYILQDKTNKFAKKCINTPLTSSTNEGCHVAPLTQVWYM